MPFAATWMDLEIIILIEVCQKKERQLPDITYIWNPKYVTSGPTYKAETDSQMIEKQLVVAKVGEGWTGSLGAQTPKGPPVQLLFGRSAMPNSLKPHGL